MNPEGPQVSWQNPSPEQAMQYPATAPFPTSFPIAQSPGRGPTQSAILRWVGATVVVCLLLVGAVVLHRTVLSRFFGGAASPQEAVTQAIAAIEDGDFARLGLLLPPDEVAGVGDVMKQGRRISSALGEGSGFGGHTKDTGVQVSVKNLKLATHDEQDGLTKVSIENADITASFDPTKASGPVKKYVDKKHLTARQTTITVHGADVTTDGHKRTLRIDGREQAPFVMAVQRAGSWYVSPLYTYFQYASEEEGRGTSPAATSPGFDSPVKAAEGFISALAKAINTRSITVLAQATGGVEGRLLQTYRDLVDATLDKMSRNSVSIDVNSSQFRVLSVDGSTARVRPESLHLTATSGGRKYGIDWNGRCLNVDNPRTHQRACLGDKSTIGPYTPLIERLNYLVAVRSDGGWKISATRTVFTMAADVLSWIGDAEIPVIKALTGGDPAELTKVAKVAATVRIGDTATISVDAVGPYLDGGYAVVNIPNPDGRRFSVYCQTKNLACRVVALVTPSGKSVPIYAGGRNGESGDYKAIVIAQTGDLKLSVRSR